jgi:hypothetical protein
MLRQKRFRQLQRRGTLAAHNRQFTGIAMSDSAPSRIQDVM